MSDFQIVNAVLEKYNGPGGDVEIPAGVKRIKKKAFQFCWRLTGVKIPKGVIHIGDYAFWYCDNLTSVEIPKVQR